MTSAEQDFRHTSEVKPSQADAERMVQVLEARGWTICPERVPLQGQLGYYCVRKIHRADGSCTERAHSVRWNMFEGPLVPVTVGCQDDAELLSFVWTHATHDGFYFFHYGDDDDEDDTDVGFVCYCRARLGYSYVLRVGDEMADDLSDAALHLLCAYDEYVDDRDGF